MPASNRGGPLAWGSGIVGGAAALGYAAAKTVVFGDRRRSRREPRLRLVAPPDVRHHHLTSHDGGRLHVIERGDPAAPALLLLHGVTLRAEVWAGQLLDLAAPDGPFRVLALDWRGHGTSSAGTHGYGLDLLAQDLATVLEDLDLRGVTVAGHSMGGMAIMRFVEDLRPVLDARVARLAFVATAAGDVGLNVTGRLAGAIARQPFLRDAVPLGLPGTFGYTITRIGFGPRPASSWVQETQRILSTMSSVAAGRSLAALLEHEARAVLPSLRVPVLVAVGTHDQLTPLRQSEEIADLVPGCRLEVFDGAGHMLMLERREELNEVLTDFALDRAPALPAP